MSLLKGNFSSFWFKVSWISFLCVQLMVQIVAVERKGNKPLPGPLMIHITEAYMHLRLNACMFIQLLYTFVILYNFISSTLPMVYVIAHPLLVPLTMSCSLKIKLQIWVWYTNAIHCIALFKNCHNSVNNDSEAIGNVYCKHLWLSSCPVKYFSNLIWYILLI